MTPAWSIWPLPKRIQRSITLTGVPVSEIIDMADITVHCGDTLAAIEQLNSPDAAVDAVMVVNRPR